MRRFLPFVVLALAIAAFASRHLWLPAAPGQADYLGYVEGETVLVAAPVAGRLVERQAEKGMALRKGDRVFSLDPQGAGADLAKAAAAVETAKAQLADLETGKRIPELEMIRAQRRESEAALVLARQELVRAKNLTDSGMAAKVRLETASAQVDELSARIGRYQAEEEAAKLGGRDQEIVAARSRVAEAEAAVAAAHVKLADLAPVSPVDAVVEDTYFDVGEWVGSGQPVVSLLPPGKVTLRFFVPEAVVARAQPGTPIRFTCDGCGTPRQATITHVADQAEYTPPVIYSQSARAKLVFKVEALPEQGDVLLRPGLPIEVEPLQ